MGFFTRLKSLFSRKKPPVLGLALGSGGAKGMAHLGALKAFEEAKLSFSVVTGASIGGIVGALYAKGYSAADMIGIVEGLNRKEFAKNLKPFSDLTFAERFLEDYLEGDFDTLPMPFAVSATDGVTNENVIIREGKLARALTASAAIPPFFRGVEIGDKKLYDGAFSNAIPADVCRELGAEIVVAIDLSAFVRSEEEKGRFSRIVGSAINAMSPVRNTPDCKSRGYAAADIMLRPNLYDYKATDVSRPSMDAMYEIGYEEAKAHIAEIQALIEKRTKEKKR